MSKKEQTMSKIAHSVNFCTVLKKPYMKMENIKVLKIGAKNDIM